MRNVQDALHDILQHFNPLSSETVLLGASLGRTLAEAVYAQNDLPLFDNSSMDGFAVRAEDIQSVPVTLPLVMDIPAGVAPPQALGAGQAARIMTGAAMPVGADAVVPVEQTNANNDNPELPTTVEIYQSHAAGAYVRPRGEDVQTGTHIFESGHVLRPQDLGLLAGLGVSEVSVFQRPTVALLSTGDELLLPHDPIVPGKIRDMNTYSLAAMIESLGAAVLPLGIARDTAQDVEDKLLSAVEQGANVIVSSAGVSVGTRDVVKAVLENLGAIGFWKVNMRPGKPLAFGHVQGVPFFGLPGNPVSSLASFEIFVRPSLLKLMGQFHAITTYDVVLGEDMTSDGRESYIRVVLRRENGRLTAYSTGTQSSGALSSLVKADGLLIIPADVKQVQVGDILQVRPFAGQPILF